MFTGNRLKQMSLALVVFLLPGICLSQWVQTDGPSCNTGIERMFVHDSVMVVATECGLFSREPNDDSWTYRGTMKAESFYQRENLLIAGSNRGGLWLLDLAGPDLTPSLLQIIDVTAVALSDSCLYAGNTNQGFFKINVDQSRVSFHNEGLPVQIYSHPSVGTIRIYDINSILVTEQYLFAGTNQGVFRAPGTLDQWTNISEGLPPHRNIQKLMACGEVLYAQTLAEGVFASRDQGQSWHPASQGLQIGDGGIRDFLCFENNLFCTTEEGIYYTFNKGQNWFPFNEGLTNKNTTGIVFHQNNLYTGTLGSGMWSWPDPGRILSSNPIVHDQYQITIFPNPASDHVFIPITTSHVEFFDMTGRLVLSASPGENGAINTSGLHPGLYMVIMIQGEEHVPAKLLIQRR